MRKKVTFSAGVLACLVTLGVGSWIGASDWIQQNKWTVAGPYSSSGCGPGNQFISDSLLEHMDLDVIEPVHGDAVPNTANLKMGAWPTFDTWQLLSTRNVPGGDLCNLNDTVFGSDPNDCYAVGVIYAKNLTGAPIDVVLCTGSDDAVGVLINDAVVVNVNACRGDPGCGERTPAILAEGINKIAIAAYEAGGGWNYRLQLRRAADDTVIDDSEAPDVAFDSDPAGSFDQFRLRRSFQESCPLTNQLSVSLKGNGRAENPNIVLDIVENISGAVAVSDISPPSGVFVANGQTPGQAVACSAAPTPAGDFEDHLDIGAPAFAGGTVHTPGTGLYEITAGGNDIWDCGDQFQFAYKRVSGDFSLKARIAGRGYPVAAGGYNSYPAQNPASRWGKFGLMARQDCAHDSRYSFVHDCSPDSNGTDPDNLRYAGRPNKGCGTFEAGHGLAGKHVNYLQLDRRGNHFIGYGSNDGINYHRLHSMDWGNGAPAEVLVGLAVTSHAGGASIKIDFDQVSLTTSPTSGAGGTITWTGVTRGQVNANAYTYKVTGVDSVSMSGNGIEGPGSSLLGESSSNIGVFEYAQDHGFTTGGSTTYDAASQVYTQAGSGIDIWSGGDTGQFAWKDMSGDFDITAEVVDRLQPTGSRHGRHGVMARRDCNFVSKNSFLCEYLGGSTFPPIHQIRRIHGAGDTDDFRYRFHYPDPDGAGPNQNQLPNFMKLVRRENTFYSFVSWDGESYEPIGSDTWRDQDPAQPVQVGFATGKHGGHDFAPVVKFKVLNLAPQSFSAIPDDGIGQPEEFYTTDFSDVGDWALNRRDGTFTPMEVDGRLRLTSAAVGGSSTSAFNQAIQIEEIDSQIWQFEFDVHMSHTDPNANPADGMAFVVIGYDDLEGGDLNRVGFAGGNFAYYSLADKIGGEVFPGVGDATLNVGNNNFAIEFDTWQDGSFNEGIGAPSNRLKYHLGINAGLDLSSIVQTSGSEATPLPDIFDPDGVHVKVTYNRGLVSVSLGQNSTGGDMVKFLETEVLPISYGAGHENALVGFTAGTGGATENADVDNFVLSQLGCNDIQEVAAATGPAKVKPNDTYVVDGSGSNSGPGDAGDNEVLTYVWSISGPGSIVGAANGPSVNVKASASGEIKVTLTVNDGSCDNPSSITVATLVEPDVNWVRCDCNGDSLRDVSDAVFHLTWLFVGGATPACQGACDCNSDAGFDVSDAIFDLNYQFTGGPPPAAPYPACDKFAGCASQGNC